MLRFGAFELDPARGVLRRNGVLIRLQSQPLKALIVLASRAGEVVPREDLRREIWPEGTFVDFERGLNFCINRIRRTLDEDARQPRYIETIPRSGYRFIAAVTRTPDPAPREQRSRVRGGDYTIAVELTENACGTVTVLPLPTRVNHTPGALQFELTHGPATYTGTLDAAGGGFRTAVRTFSDAASSQTVHIEGQFVVTGLQAVVTVDQAAPPPACRYLVRWTGTKVGSPNVIP